MNPVNLEGGVSYERGAPVTRDKPWQVALRRTENKIEEAYILSNIFRSARSGQTLEAYIVQIDPAKPFDPAKR